MEQLMAEWESCLTAAVAHSARTGHNVENMAELYLKQTSNNANKLHTTQAQAHAYLLETDDREVIESERVVGDNILHDIGEVIAKHDVSCKCIKCGQTRMDALVRGRKSTTGTTPAVKATPNILDEPF